jgi:hypothetical protein
VIGDHSSFSKNTVLQLLSFYYTRAVVKIQVEKPLVKITRREDVKYHLNSLSGAGFCPGVCLPRVCCIALPLINTAAHNCHPLSCEQRIHQSPATSLFPIPCSIFLPLSNLLKEPYIAFVRAREVRIFSC